MLAFHQGIGYLVVLGAIVAVFDRRARRIEQYIIALQVLIGAVLWFTQHHGPPVAHWVLALVAVALYGVANGIEKRGRPESAVRALSVLALLIVAFVFYLGMSAVKTGM
jgi:hypothetical protein